MRKIAIFVALATAVTMSWANHELQSDNPVVAAMTSLGRTGTSSKSPAAKSPGSFVPAGKRLFVETMIQELVEEKEQQEALKAYVEEILKAYEQLAKEGNYENDCAASLAFSICLLHALASNQEFTDEGYALSIKSIQASLDIPAVRNATDKQKQEAYEIVLCQAAFSVFMATVLKEGDGPKKAQEIAKVQLEAITGAKLSQITIGKSQFSIKASVTQPANPSPTANGLAPGFAYTMPTGWFENSGWLIGQHVVTEYNARSITAASIRLLPPMPAQGDFGAALRALWSKFVPKEFADKASGMVFRRFVGDGLFAQYLVGKGRETNRNCDSIYTLYLVDCGSQWQPVVVAQTYEKPDEKSPVGIEMTASFTYGESADIAEQILATFRCPSAKGKPIATVAAIAGEYNFGSGSMLQWANIYTGSTTFTHVSYGGTLGLKANGTFTYTYSSATGVGGISNFRGAKGTGTWKLQGDILITTFKTYDQGDGHFVKEHRYKVAGITQFSDGNKVLVLKSKTDQPANGVTVGDSSEYYSTKKKD